MSAVIQNAENPGENRILGALRPCKSGQFGFLKSTQFVHKTHIFASTTYTFGITYVIEKGSGWTPTLNTSHVLLEYLHSLLEGLLLWRQPLGTPTIYPRKCGPANKETPYLVVALFSAAAIFQRITMLQRFAAKHLQLVFRSITKNFFSSPSVTGRAGEVCRQEGQGICLAPTVSLCPIRGCPADKTTKPVSTPWGATNIPAEAGATQKQVKGSKNGTSTF